MNGKTILAGASAGAFIALFVVGGVTAVALLDGLALSVLWNWYAAPLFGVPALTIPLAIGLILVLRALTASRYRPAKRKHAGKALLHSLTRPLILLAIGWCAHQWVPA